MFIAEQIGSLSFVLIIGKADRFQCGKQIASYLGLVSSEDSSGTGDGWGTLRNKEFDVALLVGGSCPSYGTKHSGMA
jgi:hypothetical protein